MSASVPIRRGSAPQGDVVSGQAVRASTWLSAAELCNWMRGNGDVLIPAYDPNQTIAASASKTFAFHVTPNGRAVRRIWSVAIIGTGTVTVTAGTAAATTSSLTGSTIDPTLITVNEDLSAKSSAAASLTLIVANSASSGTVTVVSISCHEAPRARLDLDATDLGVDTLTTMARAPIDRRANESIGGLIVAHESMRPATGGKLRRASYLAYARPANTTDCWVNATAVYAVVLMDGGILGRKLYPTDTKATITWWFYVSSTAGTTGTVRVTRSGGGGSVTATIPDSTSWSWISVTQSYPCEDLTEDDGLQASTWPGFDIDLKTTTGAGSVYLASACAEEN